MTTANARTNAAGHTVAGMDSTFGDITCKTGQFVIHTPDGGGVFEEEENMIPDCGSAVCVIGDLLGSKSNYLAIIAEHIFEGGVSLTCPCRVMRPRYSTASKCEIWTRTERFKIITGRVYGHKIYNTRWRWIDEH